MSMVIFKTTKMCFLSPEDSGIAPFSQVLNIATHCEEYGGQQESNREYETSAVEMDLWRQTQGVILLHVTVFFTTKRFAVRLLNGLKLLVCRAKMEMRQKLLSSCFCLSFIQSPILIIVFLAR